MLKKTTATFHLSQLTKDLLKLMATHHGLSQAGMLEMLVRLKAHELNLKTSNA